VADYQKAISFVLEHTQQQALKLVVGNYREYRALEATIALAWTTSSQPVRTDLGEPLFHLCRVLLNWLTSLRLFDDHARARLTRMYGRDSTELERYCTARAGMYDRNASYRFVCELRNYAQHCGQVPIQGSVHVSRSGREVELYFDRDELLAKFNKWKRVKHDLREGPEHIPLDDHLEAAMSSIVGLARVLAEIDQPRLATYAGTINKTVGPPPTRTGQRPAIFRMRKSDPAGSSITFDLLAALTVGKAAAQPDPVAMQAPDFRKDRPALKSERPDFKCQGPIDRVADLPAETCDQKASMSFYFPHQDGIAFIFGCDHHALQLGTWAGKRFGGSFGAEVAKAVAAMDQAKKTVAHVSTPHGEEFMSLIPVPGAPTTSSLFGHPAEATAQSSVPLKSDPPHADGDPTNL
jgi:hypothetical protein